MFTSIIHGIIYSAPICPQKSKNRGQLTPVTAVPETICSMHDKWVGWEWETFVCRQDWVLGSQFKNISLLQRIQLFTFYNVVPSELDRTSHTV